MNNKKLYVVLTSDLDDIEIAGYTDNLLMAEKYCINNGVANNWIEELPELNGDGLSEIKPCYEYRFKPDFSDRFINLPYTLTDECNSGSITTDLHC